MSKGCTAAGAGGGAAVPAAIQQELIRVAAAHVPGGCKMRGRGRAPVHNAGRGLLVQRQRGHSRLWLMGLLVASTTAERARTWPPVSALTCMAFIIGNGQLHCVAAAEPGREQGHWN